MKINWKETLCLYIYTNAFKSFHKTETEVEVLRCERQEQSNISKTLPDLGGRYVGHFLAQTWLDIFRHCCRVMWNIVL